MRAAGENQRCTPQRSINMGLYRPGAGGRMASAGASCTVARMALSVASTAADKATQCEAQCVETSDRRLSRLRGEATTVVVAGACKTRGRNLQCAPQVIRGSISHWIFGRARALTRAISIELAPHNIRVNTVCPTFVETPLTKPFFEDAVFKAEVLTKIKLGRLSRVQDLMGAIVFLASDASSMMTGSAMLIDGGWNAD